MRTPRSSSRWATGLLVLWLAGWVFVHAAVSWQTTPPAGSRSFNSPDETANHVFSRRLAGGQPLPLVEPLAAVGNGIVHPRGTAIWQGRIVPLSFLGLPVWYGVIGSLMHPAVIPYLTPVVAALGGLALWRFLRGIFSPTVAWWSAASLPLLPPWWYYAARGLFHQVPFVASVVVGLWLAGRLHRQGGLISALGVGVSFGFALTLRTIEAIWVVPLVVGLIVACPRQHRRWWWVSGAAMLLSLLPVVVQQWATYGSPWRLGYVLPPPDGGQSMAIGGFPWLTVFPYGLHPRLIVQNVWRYALQLLPWVTWPALVGAAALLARWRTRSAAQRGYLGAVALLAVVTLPYYGSARISDNLNPDAVTLGMSYARYWLPLAVAALPLMVLGWQWVAGWLPRPVWRHGALTLLAAGFAVWSVRLTWFAGDESLSRVVAAVQQGYTKRERVAAVVAPSAVIVAERADKLFFPSFPVVATLLDAGVQRDLPALVALRPVYYYTFLDDAGIRRLTPALDRVGLKLQDPVPIVDGERLWRVVSR